MIRYDELSDDRRMEIFKELTEKMWALYNKKHSDYGLSFEKSFHEYGPAASMIRVEDKINRYKNLINNKSLYDFIGSMDGKVGESVLDTLIDGANYLVMMATELKLIKETLERDKDTGKNLFRYDSDASKSIY